MVVADCQAAGEAMEPFEVREDGQGLLLTVGGENILQFLKQVFDVEPVELEEDTVAEKAFVIDLHQPQYFASRSDALRLVRSAVRLGCMWLRRGGGRLHGLSEELFRRQRVPRPDLRLSRVIPVREGNQLRCWGAGTAATWRMCSTKLQCLGTWRVASESEARRSQEALVWAKGGRVVSENEAIALRNAIVMRTFVT